MLIGNYFICWNGGLEAGLLHFVAAMIIITVAYGGTLCLRKKTTVSAINQSGGALIIGGAHRSSMIILETASCALASACLSLLLIDFLVDIFFLPSSLSFLLILISYIFIIAIECLRELFGLIYSVLSVIFSLAVLFVALLSNIPTAHLSSHQSFHGGSFKSWIFCLPYAMWFLFGIDHLHHFSQSRRFMPAGGTPSLHVVLTTLAFLLILSLSILFLTSSLQSEDELSEEFYPLRFALRVVGVDTSSSVALICLVPVLLSIYSRTTHIKHIIFSVYPSLRSNRLLALMIGVWCSVHAIILDLFFRSQFTAFDVFCASAVLQLLAHLILVVLFWQTQCDCCVSVCSLLAACVAVVWVLVLASIAMTRPLAILLALCSLCALCCLYLVLHLMYFFPIAPQTGVQLIASLLLSNHINAPPHEPVTQHSAISFIGARLSSRIDPFDDTITTHTEAMSQTSADIVDACRAFDARWQQRCMAAIELEAINEWEEDEKELHRRKQEKISEDMERWRGGKHQPTLDSLLERSVDREDDFWRTRSQDVESQFLCSHMSLSLSQKHDKVLSGINTIWEGDDK